MTGLLDCFKRAANPESAVTTFLRLYADEEDDPAVLAQMTSFVAQMRDAGILVSEERRDPQTLYGRLYAQSGAHVNMLSDYARTSCYREALARQVRGKVVAEVGCGSGALACLAAKAGARRVYAIEETSIIHLARQIVSANGLDDVIVLIEGNSAEVNLPEQVDVLYSELIGSDPLVEGMLAALRDSAARFLAPGGIMIPRRMSISAVGIHSSSVRRDRYVAQQVLAQAERLGRTYALDLAPLVEAFRHQVRSREASWQLMERVGDPLVLSDWDGANEILTDEAMLVDLDLVASDLGSSAAATPGVRSSVNRSMATVIHAPLRLAVRCPGRLNAVAVYFDAEMDDELVLSNSPFSVQMPINWGGQLIRPVEEAEVRPGDVISLEATIDPSEEPTVSFGWPSP